MNALVFAALVAIASARCLASDLGLSPVLFSSMFGNAASAGDVTIGAGAVVLLDASPTVTLGTVTISGTLVVDDSSSAALLLKAKAVIVANGGKLLIGTASCRVDRDVTLQFVGTLAASNRIVNFKALVVETGGVASIYGRNVPSSWANLASTASPGDKTIRLQQDVGGWQVGDRLAIVATAYLAAESEIRRVASVDAASNIVTLDAPLSNVHFGGGWSRDKLDINMRGEVARLDRNIRIVGDDSDRSFSDDGFGVHTIALTGARLNFDGVQFERCGQVRNVVLNVFT